MEDVCTRVSCGKTNLNPPAASPHDSLSGATAVVSSLSLETTVSTDHRSVGSTEGGDAGDKNVALVHDISLGPDGYFLADDEQRNTRQQTTNNRIRSLLNSFKSSYSGPASPPLGIDGNLSRGEVAGGERDEGVVSEACIRAPAEEFMSFVNPSEDTELDRKEHLQFFPGPRSRPTEGDQPRNTKDEGKPPWLEGKQEGWHTLDFFHRLHEECFEFLRGIEPFEDEEDQRVAVLSRVKAVAQTLWPYCSVCPFGSYYTGLALPQADLDICLYIETEPPLFDSYSDLSSVDTNRNPPDFAEEEARHSGIKGPFFSSSSPSSSSSATPHEAYGKFASLAEKLTHGSKALRETELSLLRVGRTPRNRRDKGVRHLRRFASLLSLCKIVDRRSSSSLSPVMVPMTADLHVISSARVPICRFVDTATGVKVDVCVDQPSSVFTSLYVRLQLLRYPLLRPLVLLNKAALREWGLNEPFRGGVGSYLLFVMVLNFLQVNHRLYDRENHCQYSIGHALVEFLHYYGVAFNYSATGLSVRDKGRLFPKSSRNWLYPEEIRQSTFNKPPSPYTVDHYTNQRFLLAAESPLEPDRDIGRGAYQMPRVRWEWRRAYTALAHRLCQEASPGPGLPLHGEDSLLKLFFNIRDDSYNEVFGSSGRPRASGTDEDGVSLPGDGETDTDNSSHSSPADTRRSAPPTTRQTSYLRAGVCGLRRVAIAPSAALLSREKRGLETFILFENCPGSAHHKSRHIERNRRGMKLLKKKLKMLEKQASRMGTSSNIKFGEGQSSGTEENEPRGWSDRMVEDLNLLETSRDKDSVGDKELTGGVGLELSSEAKQGRSPKHWRKSRKRGRTDSGISSTNDETSEDNSRGEATARWAELLEGRVSKDRRNAVAKKKRIQGEEKRNTATSRKATVSTADLINLCSTSSSDSSSQEEQESPSYDGQCRQKSMDDKKKGKTRGGTALRQAVSPPERTNAGRQDQGGRSWSEESVEGESGNPDDKFEGTSEALRKQSVSPLTDGQTRQSTRYRAENLRTRTRARDIIALSDDGTSVSGSDQELSLQGTASVKGRTHSLLREDACNGRAVDTKMRPAHRRPAPARRKVKCRGETGRESVDAGLEGSSESEFCSLRRERTSRRERDTPASEESSDEDDAGSQPLQSFDLGGPEAEEAASGILLHLEQRRVVGGVWDDNSTDSSAESESF
ncbi:dna-directed dna polymerase [Cystoisospora suis]|uniref:Dna-directed dna polymerase n=1 Tax=Cystoisospora suis TaxID=483139 RepID=A0A2C6JI25_9APIC|nr:dna-directed dna polymerase [Cystoisospora suis]